MALLLEGKLIMPNIPELLRQLADAIEQNQHEQECMRVAERNRVDDLVSHVDVLAHKNEDKLQRIGKILMED